MLSELAVKKSGKAEKRNIVSLKRDSDADHEQPNHWELSKSNSPMLQFKNDKPGKRFRIVLENILREDLYFNSDIANQLLVTALKTNKFNLHSELVKNTLSEREIEIIHHITNEFTNSEISEKLEVSKRTIDNHRQNILTKLNLKNSSGLVRFAIENNVFDSSSFA